MRLLKSKKSKLTIRKSLKVRFGLEMRFCKLKLISFLELTGKEL
jgi:hypothetical protein